MYSLRFSKTLTILATTLSISVFAAQPALADCKSEIQAIMKAGETDENYVLVVELSMGGQVFQNSKQLYKDYSHFYHIVQQTGVHWLVLGDQEFTSSDGTNWTAGQKRDPAWLTETLKRNEETRATIKDVACGSEQVGGKDLSTYTYVQETTVPVESVSTVTFWVDPVTSLPVKRQMKTLTGGQEIETSILYEWPNALDLPTP
ncbi:hypothetical protein [Roseibium sp. M-1]